MRLKSQLLAIVAESTMVINIHAGEEQENKATGEDTAGVEEGLNAKKAKTGDSVEGQTNAGAGVLDDVSKKVIIECFQKGDWSIRRD